MVNSKKFDSNVLKIDKKSDKSIDIYYIGYITMKNMGNYKSIHIVNPLYLIIHEVDGSIECNSVERKSGNKYLVFTFTDKNKTALEKCT